MNEVTSIHNQPAPRQGTAAPVETRKTGTAEMSDMTYLILAAIAAALLAGLLVLPVTLPGTARLWAQADLPAPHDPTALAKVPMFVQA